MRNKTTQKSKAIENLARSKEDVEIDDTLDPAENSISKSQKKRNMIALQSVGEELVAWVQPDHIHAEPVRLTLPDGTVQTLSLHDETVRLRLDRPGRYRLSRGQDSVTVVATVEVREKLEMARDDARLSRLAQATGGEAAE